MECGVVVGGCFDRYCLLRIVIIYALWDCKVYHEVVCFGFYFMQLVG